MIFTSLTGLSMILYFISESTVGYLFEKPKDDVESTEELNDNLRIRTEMKNLKNPLK